MRAMEYSLDMRSIFPFYNAGQFFHYPNRQTHPHPNVCRFTHPFSITNHMLIHVCSVSVRVQKRACIYSHSDLKFLDVYSLL